MPRPFTARELEAATRRLTRRVSTDRFLGAYLDDRKVMVERDPTDDHFHIFFVRDPGREALHLLDHQQRPSAAEAAACANAFLEG